MIIIVTGDRNWNETGIVDRLFQKFGKGHTLVHGNCRGADLIAARAAKKLGWNVVAYPAEWERYGKAAGPIRNRKMLSEFPDANMVIAFHDDLKNSRGTKDMVNEAKKRGFNIVYITTAFKEGSYEAENR